MALLEDIQQAAVDGSQDLGTLLRKLKLLAARIGNKALDDWLIWEANGYPREIDVPSYRTWEMQLKGNFSGYFGKELRNAPIPFKCLPDKLRENFEYYRCRQSIVGVESTLARSEGGSFFVSTGDLALLLAGDVYEGMNCVEAWGEIAPGHLLELLNSVRNRILDFALALWKEEPTLGDISTGSPRTIEPSKVTQIFNTTVYEGSANILGNVSHSQVSFGIAAGDFDAIASVLRGRGLTEADVGALKSALETDARPDSASRFGPLVSDWISKMVGKAASGGWKIGIGAAGSLLAQLIARYYGF